MFLALLPQEMELVLLFLHSLRGPACLLKETFLPGSAKPTAGQQTTGTAAEKMLHWQLSGAWFNLPPWQPALCRAQASPYLLPLVHLRLAHDEIENPKTSQDSKEHEQYTVLIHRAAQGKHMTQFCKKICRISSASCGRKSLNPHR